MTELTLVKSLSDIEHDTEAKSLNDRILAKGKLALDLVIVDEKTLMQANDLRLEIKALEKEVDERRKFFVDPHNQFVKAINAWFKNTLDTAALAIGEINRSMVAYSDKKDAEAAEAQRKILSDKRTLPETKSEKLAQVEQAPTAVTSAAGQTTFRIDKRLDLFDENLVPREYCRPDPQAIFAALKEGKQIPGCRLIDVKVPVGRSNL